jgi:hypothetical protein
MKTTHTHTAIVVFHLKMRLVKNTWRKIHEQDIIVDIEVINRLYHGNNFILFCLFLNYIYGHIYMYERGSMINNNIHKWLDKFWKSLICFYQGRFTFSDLKNKWHFHSSRNKCSLFLSVCQNKQKMHLYLSSSHQVAISF